MSVEAEIRFDMWRELFKIALDGAVNAGIESDKWIEAGLLVERAALIADKAVALIQQRAAEAQAAKE